MFRPSFRQRCCMPDSKKIFEEILKAGPGTDTNRVLAIFDLDSTLFDVSGRSARILHDFCADAEMLKKYPADIERLKLIRVQPGDWGIREAIIRQGWEAPPDFFVAVRDFWRTHFFSNHYLVYDRPYDGALAFVKAIADAGIAIKYLTGRDRPDMFEGTVEGLRRHGFPLENETSQLYMKPAKGVGEDEDFKTSIILQFSRDFSPIYFFENEPVIINKVLIAAPEVRVVFLDTVHSRQAIVPPHLPIIRRFHTRG